MKSTSFSVLALVFAAAWLLCWSSSTPAADSTSFNPTTVQVQAEAPGGIPIGTIVAWPVETNPADWDKWLEANGQLIDPVVYPELVMIFGPRLPDLRGLFLRGHGSQVHSQVNGSAVGITSTVHSSGALGQIQGDTTRRLFGTGGTTYKAGGYSGSFQDGAWQGGFLGDSRYQELYSLIFDSSRITPTDNENRPANMAVRYLVRALK